MRQSLIHLVFLAFSPTVVGRDVRVNDENMLVRDIFTAPYKTVFKHLGAASG